jgi:thiol-disulfide isomerase/thioredoxin
LQPLGTIGTVMNFLKRSLLPVFLLTLMLSWSEAAQAATVTWRKNLKTAAAEAEKSGKSILIQFTAEWCGYCHKMLAETYTDEAVIRQVNDCFIPVVLDADEHERLIEAIGVSAFPTTVIIAPNLDVEAKIEGFHRPAGFTQRIELYCRKQTAARAEVASEAPAAPSLKQPIRPATASLETAPTAGEPVAAPALLPEQTPTAQKPPVAFEGLCLVSLLNARQFKPGDKTIIHEYNDVTLQFASEETRREFAANPAKFWPVADGHCPVATVNAEKDSGGDVRTVAVFRGRLVIFHSVQHRNEFSTRPGDYLQRLEQVQQARR